MRNYINQDIYLTEFNVHKKYAPSELLLDLVWTHCNIVAEVAYNILLKKTLDQQVYNPGLVIQAGLMHDVGIYVCDGFDWLTNEPPNNKPYIQHTVAGAWLLQQEGFSAEVVGSAHTHTGVGITTEDIKKYGLLLPDGDYTPTTAIQRLISYSSKFHSKAPKFKDISQIKESLKKYGSEKEKVFDGMVEEFGAPDLLEISEKYKNWHRSFQYDISKLMSQSQVNLNSAGIATAFTGPDS